MKVILPRLDLVSLIGKIQNIVSPKPAIPILANILLEATADQLILSATDLTISMRAYTEAQVLEEGAITLPARRFFQLIRELTTPSVEIHAASPEIASINAGTSHFKIQGMHKSEFPLFPDLTEGTVFSLNSGSLKEMLSRTAFAAARDEANRPALNGVHLSHTDGTLTFTGTDGKRLARNQTAVTASPLHTGSSIIPVKAVDEMSRMLESKEEPVTLTLMADKVALEAGPITLISKLISGQYPDVDRIFPQQQPQPIALHREELVSLLRQVSLFIAEHGNPVRFSFAPGELHISAMSGEIGEGTVNMPVNYGGEKIDIAFNPIYFLDILRHIKDETVNFNISDPYNPGLVTDSSQAQFVIMPMRMEN